MQKSKRSHSPETDLIQMLNRNVSLVWSKTSNSWQRESVELRNFSSYLTRSLLAMKVYENRIKINENFKFETDKRKPLQRPNKPQKS